jgi:hypothetical protein
MPLPVCPYCKEGNLEIKEKYPNAMLEVLKERFLQCSKCGYKCTSGEMKKIMKEAKK